MQFTGSELTLKRNFYTQTGNYGFVMAATVDNTTGAYHFGLSGAQGMLDFRLESGRMHWGNQFIQSYRSYEQFIVEGQFSSGAVNVTDNNSPLLYGAAKATGNFDYFYFTRASTDMGATFSVEVSGNNSPIYSITQQGYLFSSGQNAVTGWFANQGAFPIRVFDQTTQASANYDVGELAGNIATGGSGAFAYTGDYSVLNFSQPLLNTFATNFGDITALFSIIDARSFSSFVQLTAPTDFTFNTNNVLNRNVSYLNFSGGVVSNNFNTNLMFLLGYVSGSGNFTIVANYSISGIGRFNQSGYLTGLLTTSTGNQPVTGFAWATGAASGFFSGVGTGIASGINYTGLATGFMTGRATGFIFDGSGTLNLTFPLVGSGFISRPISPTGAIFATGYIDFSSYSSANGFSISNPDASTTFTMRAAGGPGDPPAPSCDGAGTYLMDVLSQITGIAPCISGFTSIGVNAIYDGFNTIRLTALTAGLAGNDIITSTDWSSPGDGNLIGGIDGFVPTFPVYPLGTPYTGAFPITLTGSGSYAGTLTGQYYLPYSKTFTGSWQLATGGSPTSLVNFTPISSILYSGNGTFSPNSFMNLQVTYNPSGITPDGAYLIITGSNLINGVNRQLSLP